MDGRVVVGGDLAADRACGAAARDAPRRRLRLAARRTARRTSSRRPAIWNRRRQLVLGGRLGRAEVRRKHRNARRERLNGSISSQAGFGSMAVRRRIAWRGRAGRRLGAIRQLGDAGACLAAARQRRHRKRRRGFAAGARWSAGRRRGGFGVFALADCAAGGVSGITANSRSGDACGGAAAAVFLS